jgi:hypothetical protein
MLLLAFAGANMSAGFTIFASVVFSDLKIAKLFRTAQTTYNKVVMIRRLGPTRPTIMALAQGLLSWYTVEVVNPAKD